mgnify:CR=1 FL=1
MTTVNQEEIQKFSKLAEEWWDVSGKFKPLHMFNPVRIEYILEKKLPYVSGPQMLGEELKDRNVFAVSGTHGKTTVTSMIAHALIENNFDANYLIAGIPNKLETSWNISKSDSLALAKSIVPPSRSPL